MTRSSDLAHNNASKLHNVLYISGIESEISAVAVGLLEHLSGPNSSSKSFGIKSVNITLLLVHLLAY